MATILASWELGRGYGHLATLAPAARALNALGHRTVLASKESDMLAALADPPFAALLRAPLFHVPVPPQPTLTYATVIGDGGLNDPAAATALVRAWLDIFKAVSPAALLSEHAPASLLAAHVAGVPAARIGTGFSVPPARRPMPSLLPWEKASEADRAEADSIADRTVRAVCRAFGAPLLDGLAELLASGSACLATWPELDIYGARTDAVYYGPMRGFGGRARPEWPGGQGPRVFVYMPFDYEGAAPLIAALTTLGWSTIWHSPQTPPFLPATILHSIEPVDMHHVLFGADVQVGRAGHSSVCDGLRAGCRHLLMPDTLETLLLSGRLASQRLGLRAPEGVDPNDVIALLERLVSDAAISAATDAIRDRYAVYHPDAAAAELASDLVVGWRL